MRLVMQSTNVIFKLLCNEMCQYLEGLYNSVNHYFLWKLINLTDIMSRGLQEKLSHSPLPVNLIPQEEMDTTQF